ncbi:hypothetical protein GLAREA_09374 [Glarea lozoyensis ATCC 20868]|uniref:Ecp2 effector protein domain-containing protein n=1 Tax=Glarea lozoyensis (strain ATCC 20868 / MF5171) TaxID=1116229 RepID=S3CT81_GLAL2|nr:uncharacterized protein GLAREA_09374 [Glarea lozoyensis ATCC 20868]EPE28254.1 hypothetical protein GLAREA_09374 [Glarea lozoyensis ATCC 20868]
MTQLLSVVILAMTSLTEANKKVSEIKCNPAPHFKSWWQEGFEAVYTDLGVEGTTGRVEVLPGGCSELSKAIRHGVTTNAQVCSTRGDKIYPSRAYLSSYILDIHNVCTGKDLPHDVKEGILEDTDGYYVRVYNDAQ